MDDALMERIEALERTIADGEFDQELSEPVELQQRLSAVESQLETVDAQLDDLEAATQALRGYVGNIRAVNEDIEQRANTALAKAEAVEATLDSNHSRTDPPRAGDQSPYQTPTADSGERNEVRSVDTAERCQACGRTHEGTERGESPTTETPGATDGGSPAHRSEPEAVPDDVLLAEEPDETGRLQRIREML